MHFSNLTRTPMPPATRDTVAPTGPVTLLLTAALGLCSATGCATRRAAAPPAQTRPCEPGDLVGRWTVDLRASPGEAAYTQPFVVESVNATKGSIAGSFYNSTISWSRLNSAWGKVVVTFVTSDGQGDYVHTATLENGRLVGTSSAQHRNLLVPWTATRDGV
ncbi:MAG: hypothetical protein MUC36_20920 [Planctomycetes bacterium]|nr:hypothetical protein [Planctomycetota bacterium]